MFSGPLPLLCPICGLRECNQHGGKGLRKLFRTEQEIISGAGNVLRLTERVYLTADGKKVVSHGDPEASTLLGVKGSLISEADAKRLGVSATEKADDLPVNSPAPLRVSLAAVPGDPTDDSLYDDQSDRGKEARRLAREYATGGVYDFVKSTGGTDEEAQQSAAEATGAAAPQGPTIEEQQAQNASLTGDAGPGKSSKK